MVFIVCVCDDLSRFLVKLVDLAVQGKGALPHASQPYYRNTMKHVLHEIDASLLSPLANLTTESRAIIAEMLSHLKNLLK